VTHLRKIEGFRWTVPLEMVLSRVVRHQRPSINSPMLQPARVLMDDGTLIAVAIQTQMVL
jgi:hypothetical protein